MKKSLFFLVLFFCFINVVSAYTSCFDVPYCNGTTTVYTNQCYSSPVTTQLRMIVDTPVFSNTNTLAVPVNYSSHYVTSDVSLYIPEIKGYIFKRYTYNGSAISSTSQIKASAAKRVITGTTCSVSSSGVVSSVKVNVGTIVSSFLPIDLESEWEAVDYDLELVDDLGVFNSVMTVNATKTSVTLPTTAIQDSVYVFDGWYYDSKFTKPVESDVIVDLDFEEVYGGTYGSVTGIKTGYKKLTLYAKWIKTCLDNPEYTLSYDTNGGTKISSETLNVSVGSDTPSKLPIPTKSGYTFVGWYYDLGLTKKVETAYKEELKYTSISDKNGCPAIADLTIYAKWQKNTNSSSNSEKNDIENNKTDDKKEEKEEIVCPTESYYYKVIYNTNGGVGLESVTVCSSCELENVELPKSKRDGYAFDGWYYDANLIEKVDVNDITKLKYEQEYDENECIKLTEVNLYAKWINEANIGFEDRQEYTIRYVTNGGTQMYNDSICFNCNTKTKLVVPEKSGFKFVGWYYDEKYSLKADVEYLEELEISSVLAESTTITLYAKWEIDKPEIDDNFIIKILLVIIGVLLILVFIVSLIKKKRKKKNEYADIEVLGL